MFNRSQNSLWPTGHPTEATLPSGFVWKRNILKENDWRDAEV